MEDNSNLSNLLGNNGSNDDNNNGNSEWFNQMMELINTPVEYCNDNFNDNIFIKFFFAFLLLNPLISLFIQKKKLNRILSRNQVQQLELGVFAILVLFLIFGGFFGAHGSGSTFIKFVCLFFLFVHLYFFNNGELVNRMRELRRRYYQKKGD